jgi:hypothetical protein
MYIALIAPPRGGKTSAIEHAARLCSETEKLHIAPDGMSSASLIDALEKARQSIPKEDGSGFIEFHSLSIFGDELGVLIPKYDPAILSNLSSFYDCKDNFREEKRTLATSKRIFDPSVSILIGAQPDFLKDLLPEVAWGQGFMARVIMVFSGDKIYPDATGMFDVVEKPSLFRPEFKARLKDICRQFGRFRLDKHATAAFEKWINNKCFPEPQHPRLTHYCGERMIHAIKLAMISSISRGQSMTICLLDFDRALGWLHEAEVEMPKIFHAMGGKGDKALALDLHAYLLTVQEKLGTNIIRDKFAYEYLLGNIPMSKIPEIIEASQRLGLLKIHLPSSIEAIKKEVGDADSLPE